MNYKLIKLNNGEEIIGDVIENESNVIIEKPMVFVTMTMTDPSGYPVNVVVLRDWLSYSDNKVIEIEKSKIIVITEPGKKTINLYVLEINKSQKQPDNSNQENLFQDMMTNLFEQMVEDSITGANENFNAIENEPKKKKKRKKKDISFDRVEEPEMIYLSMMIPPELLMNMVTSGIIDPKAIQAMVNETKKRNKFTGDEKDRKDFGNKFSDWNPDPLSDDYS
jgi:hypothetical protein